MATSFQQRDRERKQKILELELSGSVRNAAQARLLRRLQRAEATKAVMTKIRTARTTGRRTGVTSIEIPVHPEDDPKTCTEWRVIDVPSEVVEHLQRRNRTHFGQAHGTPFTVPPLAEELGFCGDGPSGAAILTGHYDTSQFDKNVALLLQHLQQVHIVAQHPNYPSISEAELIGKLKVWRESTTTSPSGLHLGHYKALIARHQYSDDESDSGGLDADGNQIQSKKEEWDYMQRELRLFHLNLINYALEPGYSYACWRSVVNTILFKEENNIRIHRTRVIHIYEADYNLVLGLKWRVALYQSEALNNLNMGQYGSRPRRNAVDPVMIEELQLELSRITRRMFLQTNYDATACYDRIIPNLAVLASQKYGVHAKVAQSNARTLQAAKYKVRTELGISETSYSHCDDDPTYGTGQGAGNASMVWGFISCTLFDIYDKQATPATYQNPDRSNLITLAMIGFVDDNNGHVNCFSIAQDNEGLLWMVREATKNANAWAGLLGATGGALELPKCSYHILYWKFTPQGAPVLANVLEDVPRIVVRDPYANTERELEYLSPYTAHKTLGHYKDPAGGQLEQYEQLKSKSNNITDFLWKVPLSRAEAWTYYSACYVPAAVTYPLTGSHMTRPQLEKVQQKAMSIIISRCGFNRNTQRAIIFGPHGLGGENFRHLYVEQGLQQVTYFLRQWRLQSFVGRLFRCVIAWLQVAVGVSYPILEYPKRDLPHMEALWISSMRMFLGSTDTMLRLDDPYVPPRQREHDDYLMDLILASNHYTKAEIRKLN